MDGCSLLWRVIPDDELGSRWWLKILYRSFDHTIHFVISWGYGHESTKDFDSYSSSGKIIYILVKTTHEKLFYYDVSNEKNVSSEPIQLGRSWNKYLFLSDDRKQVTITCRILICRANCWISQKVRLDQVNFSMALPPFKRQNRSVMRP